MNGTRAGALALLLSLSLSGLACSSGGGASLTEIQQALEDCSQDGVIDVVRVLGNLNVIFDVAQGDAVPDNMTWTPTGTANEFDYSISFPRTGNGADDTRVTGTIQFSDDPTDGIALGDTATLDGTITSLGGPLTGNFQLDLEFTEAGLSITGDLLLNNSDGCDFDISINASDPLVVAFGDFIPMLAVNVLGIEVSGTLYISFSALGHPVNAVVVLTPGVQNAMVSGDLDDEPFDAFEVEVFPDPAEVQSLISCFYFGGEGAFSILEDLGSVYDAIGDPGSYPDITVQPGVPSGGQIAYDFTADFGDYSAEGTIRVPTDPNGTGSTTFTFTSNTVMLTGTTGFSGSGTFYINFSGGDPASAYGTVSLTTDDGCVVDTEFHQSDPVVLDGDLFDAGLVTFTATALGNTLHLLVDFSAPTPEEGVLEANINGISIPGALIFLVS